MRKRTLLLPALALAGTLGYTVVAPWARAYVRHGVHVEIEEALAREKPARESSGLRRAADALRSAASAVLADELHVRLRVRNQTPLPARIRSARYRVRIGGRSVGEGVWTAPGGAQWFLPGRDAVLVAALDPDWVALGAAGLDGALGSAAPISVSGELTVSLWGSGFAVPFEVSRVGWTRRSP